MPDMAAARCPSYAVIGRDIHGNEWKQVLTIYQDRLIKIEKDWWYSKVPAGKSYPGLP